MQNILDKQREFFKSGATLSVKVRLEYLKKLKGRFRGRGAADNQGYSQFPAFKQ